MVGFEGEKEEEEDFVGGIEDEQRRQSDAGVWIGRWALEDEKDEQVEEDARAGRAKVGFMSDKVPWAGSARSMCSMGPSGMWRLDASSRGVGERFKRGA